MFSARTLIFLTTAAFSATAAAVGSSTIINNCANTFDTITVAPLSPSAGTQSSLASGASTSATHSSDGYRIKLYKDGNAGAIVAFETTLDTQRNIVYYDVYIDGSSPVGNDFAVTTSDGDCPGIQGGQGNFDPVQPDLYSCSPDASFTFTLCP